MGQNKEFPNYNAELEQIAPEQLPVEKRVCIPYSFLQRKLVLPVQYQ